MQSSKRKVCLDPWNRSQVGLSHGPKSQDVPWPQVHDASPRTWVRGLGKFWGLVLWSPTHGPAVLCTTVPCRHAQEPDPMASGSRVHLGFIMCRFWSCPPPPPRWRKTSPKNWYLGVHLQPSRYQIKAHVI